MTSLRARDPAGRIAAIADDACVERLPAAGPSPHLARYGIAARDDDGIVTARIRVHGRAMFAAAQDETFVGGSVGERHASALASLATQAIAERAEAIVLLMASGGVRLYEANPAELALARALSRLLDARASGIAVLALGVGDVFGGASVVAAAADRLALAAGTRFGVSGPKVIESASGKAELDASDDDAVRALFGADARATSGLADLAADDADVARAWIEASVRAVRPFDEAVDATHARLSARLGDLAARRAFGALPPTVPAFAGAQAIDRAQALWTLGDDEIYLTRPCGDAPFGPAAAFALDDALLARFARETPGARATIVVVEDSTGHETSRRAEAAGLAMFLAHHASVLARLRRRGHRVIGLLAGTGAGAAFFANALQGSPLVALAGARVVAMPPRAIARVTGQDAAALDARIEGDPLVGHPVRHFASWGGVAQVIGRADAAAIESLASV